MRAVGIVEKLLLRRALKSGRSMLIPTEEFYKRHKNGSSKQLWRITLKDGERFGCAGEAPGRALQLYATHRGRGAVARLSLHLSRRLHGRNSSFAD
jgi:hypothetical protein